MIETLFELAVGVMLFALMCKALIGKWPWQT
jgi:hypothetical protein